MALRASPRCGLVDAVNIPYPFVCTASGSPDLGAAFRSSFQCDARVLFVSGSIDALAPESNVEALLDGFPNAAHIVAENAGHEPIEMLSAEFRLLLGAFLNGEEVASGRVARPAPKFRWDSLG